MFLFRTNSLLMSALFARISTVQTSNPYFAKDLEKARHATKFIGRGSALSSTNKYMQAAGDLANCRRYEASDIIFVSAEGARKNRLEVDFEELARAVREGVTFVTDIAYDRNRPYNVGERTVATYLSDFGYRDNGKGYWSKA